MEMITERALLVRIYLGEADKHGHEALYKHIVRLLRARGIWGATAYRGIMGYGAKSVVHAASPLVLSQDLPITIEVIDHAERLERVLPEIDALLQDGLILTHEVRVRRHVAGQAGPTD